MYFDQKAELHIVDVATKFSSACYFPNASTTSVWAAFEKCWAGVYISLPSKFVLTDVLALIMIFTLFSMVT